MNELEKTNRINMLIDIYGDLLTEKQQRYLSMYYEEDLSLSEIAEILEVSRNAVYDQLRRALHALEEYEERLNLLEKHQARLDLIERIEKEEEIDHSSLHTYLERLKEI